MLQDEGIVIRVQPLTETSLIVTWLTRDHGLTRTAARGARRAKSPLAGRLDLYFDCTLTWVESRSSDLHQLREVQLHRPRLTLRGRYAKLTTAAWFCHLILITTEPDSPVPELHELMRRALDYLEKEEPSERLLERFEGRLARELGIAQGESGLRNLQELFALQMKRRPVNT